MSFIVERIEKLLPTKKIDVFGKDSLLNTSLPYYLLALLSVAGLLTKNPDPFFFITIIYVGLPLLDQVFSLDERNPSEKERKELQKNDAYFRFAIYAAIIFDWAVFFKGCYMFSLMQVGWSNIFHLIAIIFITSNLNAAQFAVAHEIMHKPSKFYRILGTVHMLKLHYTHFTYHHLYNHHYMVATPEDPSSAGKGENVYNFFVKCVKYSFLGVYNDQKKLGKSFIMNYAVWSVAASVGFITGVYSIFGIQATVIHLMISFGAIFYLEAINYLEHYGLRRRKLDNGEYEKVTIMHSWNAPHRFTNYLLFKLQRHSDHHENSMKPYQTLVSLEKSPFLPHGYTLLILMTLFPKVWFKTMDPLVDQYTKVLNQEKDQINEEVRQTAITETRKFLIELAIFMTTISVVGWNLK